MLKDISNLGKALSKSEQKSIHGGFHECINTVEGGLLIATPQCLCIFNGGDYDICTGTCTPFGQEAPITANC